MNISFTQTPWRLGEYGGIYPVGDGPCIMTANHSDHTRRVNARGNEEFVVKCVNSHDELVAALEWFTREITTETFKNAEAVIAKARGNT